jgi:hypothetical protein
MVAVASAILRFVALPSSILWLIVTTPKHLSQENIINTKEMVNNWMGGDGSVLDGDG